MVFAFFRLATLRRRARRLWLRLNEDASNECYPWLTIPVSTGSFSQVYKAAMIIKATPLASLGFHANDPRVIKSWLLSRVIVDEIDTLRRAFGHTTVRGRAVDLDQLNMNDPRFKRVFV